MKLASGQFRIKQMQLTCSAIGWQNRCIVHGKRHARTRHIVSEAFIIMISTVYSVWKSTCFSLHLFMVFNEKDFWNYNVRNWGYYSSKYFVYCSNDLKKRIPIKKKLVPIFDGTVPSSSYHFAWFMWMPQRRDAYTFMCLPFFIQFGRLPIPDVHFTIPVAGS